MATSSIDPACAARAAADGSERPAALSDRATPKLAGPVGSPGATRTIRVGLLGLGQVGQAVARRAARTDLVAIAGLHLRIDGALVRHVTAPRRCARPVRTTSNPSAFLRGDYDVVIEALGGVEPARTLVARLLGRGIPVVTANKTLAARYGAQLAELAARRGTTFRFEAGALADVPFLGSLAARPLVSTVDRFSAIVHDDDGADELVLLTGLFAWGPLDRASIDICGTGGVTAVDQALARALGGTIRRVASAARTARGVEAFVGPAWLPAAHPLASVSGTLNGIVLHGPQLQQLFLSGPGASADLTAATLMDDAVEAVSTPGGLPAVASARATASTSPVTAWLVRLSFPGVAPPIGAVRNLVCGAGVTVEHVSDTASCGGRDACWLLVPPTPRAGLDAALATLSRIHRLSAFAIRRLEGER